MPFPSPPDPAAGGHDESSRRLKASKPPAGFTLVELMIAVAVLGVLVGIAAPRFGALIRGTRTNTTTSELAAALSLARSEATRRAEPVSVCPAGEDAAWGQGWRIVLGDGDCGGDVLRVWEAAPSSFLLVASGDGSGAVTFGALGERTSGAVSFGLGFSNCNGENARSVAVNGNGRVGTSRLDCEDLPDETD